MADEMKTGSSPLCPDSAEAPSDNCHDDVVAENAEDMQGDKDSDACQPPLTKNQLKKLKKKEKWLKRLPDKRAKERDRKKQNRKQAWEQNIELGPSRKTLKRNTMEYSECQLRVVVDCSFDNLMSERCVSQFVQQLQHCYSANRRAANPLQFYVTGTDGKTLQRLKTLGDYKGWDVHFPTHSYLKEFKRYNVVYLTSDSPNVLSTLDEDKVYVIGGLVDHNHEKGLCLKLACQESISHAQLPIGKYLHLSTRKVLTINHVFEILLRFTETHDWEKAFDCVIPKRKGFLLKSDVDAVVLNDATAVNEDRTLSEEGVGDKNGADDISEADGTPGVTVEENTSDVPPSATVEGNTSDVPSSVTVKGNMSDGTPSATIEGNTSDVPPSVTIEGNTSCQNDTGCLDVHKLTVGCTNTDGTSEHGSS